jgi:hypothetical protein
MRAGSAFLTGVIAAAVMVGLMAVARGVGITNLDVVMIRGALATGAVSGGAWVLGFIIQLIVGGLIALIYAAVFEAIRASNWGLGLLGGIIHTIIAGFVIAAFPAISTSTGALSAPGAFAAGYGAGAIGTFIVVHLVYGMIVGGSYTPVHTHRLPPATPREVHEEEPVGAGRDEHRVP